MCNAQKGTCALCLKVAHLQSSHIIPRSFFKRLKRDENQLIYIEPDNFAGKKVNADIKTYLLCNECEQFLSTNYEKKSITLLTQKSNIAKGKKNIYIYNYNHDDFYLFCISIFWRMYASNLPDFEQIKALPLKIVNLLRKTILSKKTHLIGYDYINDILRINVFKIKDLKEEIPEYIFKGILIPFIYNSDNIEVRFSFMTEGLLFILTIPINKETSKRDRNKKISTGNPLRIRVKDFREIPEIQEFVYDMVAGFKTPLDEEKNLQQKDKK